MVRYELDRGKCCVHDGNSVEDPLPLLVLIAHLNVSCGLNLMLWEIKRTEYVRWDGYLVDFVADARV